jgi:hypothetical protein
LTHTLVELDPCYPDVQPAARQQMVEARSELLAEARHSKAASKR